MLLIVVALPLSPKVKSPVPRALALLMFKVPPLRVTPPDADELFPLKVKVPPFVLFIVVSPV